MKRNDYKCKKCSYIEEGIDIRVCPKCNSEMIKIFPLISIRFTGKGFYKTDNRR
jgi:predicted nucleic acid-binding Zn ribbon protein